MHALLGMVGQQALQKFAHLHSTPSGHAHTKLMESDLLEPKHKALNHQIVGCNIS